MSPALILISGLAVAVVLAASSGELLAAEKKSGSSAGVKTLKKKSGAKADKKGGTYGGSTVNTYSLQQSWPKK